MSTLRHFATYKEDLGQAIWPKFEFSVEWISPFTVCWRCALFVFCRFIAFHELTWFLFLIHSKDNASAARPALRQREEIAQIPPSRPSMVCCLSSMLCGGGGGGGVCTPTPCWQHLFFFGLTLGRSERGRC